MATKITADIKSISMDQSESITIKISWWDPTANTNTGGYRFETVQINLTENKEPRVKLSPGISMQRIKYDGSE